MANSKRNNHKIRGELVAFEQFDVVISKATRFSRFGPPQEGIL